MARVRHEKLDCSPGCPVEGVLHLIDGKWKGVILYPLLDGTMRFNELRRRLQNVTQLMLTKQLRELEADGLVRAHRLCRRSAKGRLWLTPRGRSLDPVIMAMKRWGDDNIMPHAAA